MRFILALLGLLAVNSASAQTTPYPTCAAMVTNYQGFTYNQAKCGPTCYDPCNATYSQRLGTVWPACNTNTGLLGTVKTEPYQCQCYDAAKDWCYYTQTCFNNTLQQCTSGGLVDIPQPTTSAPTTEPATTAAATTAPATVAPTTPPST